MNQAVRKAGLEDRRWRIGGGGKEDLSCAASKVAQHTEPPPQRHEDFVGAKLLGIKLLPGFL
jgi:hypothetical protein